MKNVDILSKTDRTSWSRIAMIWRFYFPRFKRLLWSYPLASCCLFLLLLLFNPEEHRVIYFTINLMFTLYLACTPLAFASNHGREVEAMLPALGVEKCVVVLSWCFIVAPILLLGPIELLAYLHSGSHFCTNFVPGNHAQVLAVINSIGYNIYTLSILTTVCLILSCLWGVFGARRNRVLYGTLAVCIFYGAYTFLSGLIAGAAGFYAGYRAAKSGADNLPGGDDMLILVCNWLLPSLTVILIIYAIFAIIKSCRAISRHQF